MPPQSISEQYKLILSKPRVNFVGGFKEDLDKDDLVTCFGVNRQVLTVSKTFGGLVILAETKIILSSCESMWQWPKHMKKKRLQNIAVDLFYCIDKCRDERLISRRVFHVVEVLRESAQEELTW